MFQRMIFFIFLGISIICLNSVSEAALKSSKNPGEVKPEAAFNPHEDPNDIILPMPNGQKLVLRAVKIPTESFLDDHSFQTGLAVFDDDKARSLYERSGQSHISSPLLFVDLPKEWQSKVQKAGSPKNSYYFIGKYELSNGQWAAVMGEESKDRPELPKANISWYDMQDFLRKYNEWLLKNHPEAVPQIDGVPAFLRLPTEAEWEYAAKNSDMDKENDAKDKSPWSGGKPQDYAIFDKEGPMPIGSRHPNLLGIYDMAGNVAEMVQDNFRFLVVENARGDSRETRLHGSEGGPVVKGGSFKNNNVMDLMPGKRLETRMFEKQPDKSFIPHRDKGLGARVLLSSVNVPGGKRADDIEKEQGKLQETPHKRGEQNEQTSKKPVAAKAPSVNVAEGIIEIDINGKPEVELEKIYASTNSPVIKSNLKRYEALIRGYNEAFNRERSANLRSAIRSAAYQADSLSNIAFRLYELRNKLEDFKIRDKEFFKKMEPKVNEEIQRHFKNLRMSTNTYLDSVEEIAKYPADDVKSKVEQLKSEYSGSDQVNTMRRQNLDMLAKHVDIARKKGIGAIKQANVWEGCIPGKKSREFISTLQKKSTGRTGN